MQATAIVIEEPKTLDIRSLDLDAPTDADVVVETHYSGISTGTERLIWNGDMPPFPGMGFPLVPGYEAVGRVVEVGSEATHSVGDAVFVPGARCFGEVRGLFGAAASRLVVSSDRILPLPKAVSEEAEGVLFALAATALHAFRRAGVPELIIGHGVLGRLAARLSKAFGESSTVWEVSDARMGGADGYSVIRADEDDRKDYSRILDLSGDTNVLDVAVRHAARGAQVTLGGFYTPEVRFAFPPAFMREVSFNIAAEWSPEDLKEVGAMIEDGALSLAGLISHHTEAGAAADAYTTAFEDPECLKMVLDWRSIQ